MDGEEKVEVRWASCCWSLFEVLGVLVPKDYTTKVVPASREESDGNSQEHDECCKSAM